MAHLLWLATALAPGPEPLLLLGEKGTGKTSLAECIHHWSGRRGPFIDYSAPATSGALHHDALFGHDKGSYTGAHADRSGLLEEAQGGTFFIDELARSPDDLFGILLSAIDNRGIRRTGSSRARYLAVRYIAATNANVDQMVDEGRFPADLRDRFVPFVLEVPPLRERRDEILPAFRATLARVRAMDAGVDQGGLDDVPLHGDVLLLLQAAPWPGNLRQLCKEAEYVARMLRGSTEVRPDHLSVQVQAEAEAALTGMDLETLLHRAKQRQVLQAVLAMEQGNMATAATRLGVSRRHLYRIAAPPNLGETPRARGRPRKRA